MCVVCVSGVDLQFAVWSFLQFCTHESLEAKIKPGQTQKARKVVVFQMDRYHTNLQQRVCSHARVRRLTLLQFLPQKRGTCSSRCSFARWLFPYQPMSVSLYSTVSSSSLDAYTHQAVWYEEVSISFPMPRCHWRCVAQRKYSSLVLEVEKAFGYLKLGRSPARKKWTWFPYISMSSHSRGFF